MPRSVTDLPDPMVPAEVDLQDFPFMPLQVARLRDSDFAAEEDPEACWYGVLLWAASWHQIPAASLPDNDSVLMRLVGLGRDTKTWKRHRVGALRGFVLCSDGRLYHKTVAEQANASWRGKLEQRHRTFCAAVRKHNERKPDEKLEVPTFDEWDALSRPEKVAELVAERSQGQTGLVTATEPESHTENGSKREGERQGQGDSSSTKEANASSDAGASMGEQAGKPAGQEPVPDAKPVGPTAADIKKAIFDTGKAILAAAGHADPGGMIVKWRRAYRDSDLIAVLTRCQAEQPEQPIAWITAGLQVEAGHRGNSNGTGSHRPKDGAVAAFEQHALDARTSRPSAEAGRADPGDGRGLGEGSAPGFAAGGSR